MHFNAALLVLATSVMAAPSPAVGNSVGARSAAGVQNDPATIAIARQVVARHIADAVKLEVRTTASTSSTPSLDSLTSAANITLPTSVVSEVDSLYDRFPDLAPTVIGFIMTLRTSIPVLQNTPIDVVINIALPIIETLLKLLSSDNLSVRSNDGAALVERDDQLLGSLLGTVSGLIGNLISALAGGLGSATGVVSGATGALGGATGALSGATGALSGATSAVPAPLSDLLGSVTSGIDLGALGGLTNGLTSSLGTASTSSSNATAITNSILTGVTSSLTSALTSQAATILGGLPGLSGLDLANITSSSQVASKLGSLDPSALSSEAVQKLTNVLDFIISALSTVAKLPASLLPAPLDAPFKALSGELDELKILVDSLNGVIQSGFNLTDANTVKKLSDALTDVQTNLDKLSDSIIPQILQPAVKYGLAGVVALAQTVIYTVGGYIILLLQSLKSVGGAGGSGLTDTLKIFGSS